MLTKPTGTCLVFKNQNFTSVITSASHPEPISENLQSLDIFEKLTVVVLDQMESILDNRPEPESDPRKW